MSFIYKVSAVFACIGVLTSPVLAQKKVTKAAKAAITTPKIAVVRPPLLKAGTTASVAQQLQQNLMQSWNLAQAAHLERKALQARNRNNLLSVGLDIRKREAYVADKLKPLKNYLAAHQNNWPEYNRHAESNQLLRYIANFMEVEDPTPEVLSLQQQIIRLRATSNARSPYEVVKIVGDMMQYDIVPSRAMLAGKDNQNREEELALGEDLAFAMAAAKVPMPQNPWKNISGFDHIIDVVNTYNAMRRQDALLEGIPQTYTGKGGIHYFNIPLLTKTAYLNEQSHFAVIYPFEYVLAPFWERTFGRSFYRIFNKLSDKEKKAILFTAPQLPRAINENSPVFSPCYSNAVNLWEEYNHREVNNYAGVERTEKLIQFLRDDGHKMPSFRFRTPAGPALFVDLSYPEQVEVLMWIWKHLHMLPSKALERFEIDSRNYF